MARNDWHHQRGKVVTCAAVALWLLMATPSNAQQIPSLVTAGEELEQATDIKAQPLLLLSKFPSAGPALARYVAQALTKEPAAVDAVLSIIPDTSPEQAAAIGAGMVRAIRALGAKQGDVVRSFTYKIMQSDNKWLKTTFMAIGPRGPIKPPPGGGGYASGPNANNMGGNGNNGGGAFGDSLAENDSRVGPSILTNLGGESGLGIDGNPFDSQLNANLTRYGMIVAIIKSDAPGNGAVSTSPII